MKLQNMNAFMLQTVIFNYKNPAIQDKNPAIQDEKLAIETVKMVKEKQNYIVRTEERVLEVYNAIDTNQVFGAPEVKTILGCTKTVSKDIMRNLRDMNIVVEVKGKGKGKYRFVS